MEKRIQGTTRLVGLFGTPIKHSKSPEMHNFSFRQNGDDLAYLAFEVKEDEIGKAVEAARLLNMKGFNVTMPCKRAVLQYLDELDPAVELIGASNTVVNENGKFKGYNTDGSGFVRNLKENGVEVAGKSVVIFGAGGAATAVEAHLALSGVAKLVIFNRTPEKAEVMKEKIEKAVPDCAVTVHGLEDRKVIQEAVEAADIVINATSVGMKPNDAASLIEKEWLAPEKVCADVVYNPMETKFLTEAREAGCKVIGGFGMMLWQGAIAYHYFSEGKEMPLDDYKKFRESQE